MKAFENNQKPVNTITINSDAKKRLLLASKWGKLVAIGGYIVVGFLILLAVKYLNEYLFYLGTSEKVYTVEDSGFVYFIIAAVVTFIPVVYLHYFSNKIKKISDSNDEQSISLGFEKLKTLIRFIKVSAVFLILIYIGFLVFYLHSA